MPAPATNPELFELIAKSGVLEAARVKAYLERLTAMPGGVPSGPAALSERMVRDGLLTHFQAEQLMQGRWKRFYIGKYKVLEKLGVGGMGQVFLCEHKLMKRRVAVKVLPVAKAKDPATLQRFYREARAVAALDHPNIVRAYDIDEDNDLHFLVMEFVDGTNLHDLVRKSGPLPVPRACHYIYGAAVGLQHAHEMGLVHRDVKPANILVDRVGVVKLLDMGLARFFNPEEDDNLTKKFDENVLGTADYLAPEQAIDSSSVDIRADIYGLGGTFYFVLAGQPPFADGTIAQKLLWHQSKTPKPLSEYRPDLPPALVAMVDKMLAKDPAHRHQTPGELLAALGPWITTPIAPPLDAEMPQMSLAAGGSGRISPQAGGTTGSSASGIRPAVVLPPKSQPSPAAPRAIPPTTPQRPVAKPAVAQALPAPAKPPTNTPRPAATADDPANLWESITSMETTPTSGQDTGRNVPPEAEPPPKSARPTKRAAPSSRRHLAAKKSSKMPLIVAAIAGGVILLGGGITAAILILKPFGSAKTDSTAPKEREARVWFIAASGTGPDPATTRKSLMELGADLKSGDTVRFLDDSFEFGPLQLAASGKSPLRNIRLEAGNAAKQVVWTYKPPVRGAARAALEIIDAENVTVSGIVIDIGGRTDVGVQVTGSADGVTFDNVWVKNARKIGFRLVSTTAGPGRELTLSKCRVTGGDTLDAAISVAGTVKAGTSGVKVIDCRLEGTASGAAIRVDGPVMACEVRNVRAYNFEFGVQVPAVGDKFALTVERSTFHTLTQAGLKVDAPLGADQTVTLNRNYFAATAMVGKLTGDAKGLKASENGRDAATQPGGVVVTEIAGVVLLPPTPTTPDDQFLRAPGKLVFGVAMTPIGAE